MKRLKAQQDINAVRSSHLFETEKRFKSMI